MYQAHQDVDGRQSSETKQKTEVITFTAPNVEMNMPIDVIQIGDLHHSAREMYERLGSCVSTIT